MTSSEKASRLPAARPWCLLQPRLLSLLFLVVSLQLGGSAVPEDEIAAAAGEEELLDDNLALPQREGRRFILPAPGIRHRPQGALPGDAKQGYANGNQGSFEQEENLVAADSTFGAQIVPAVLGNLLPEEPQGAMPQVLTIDVACGRDRMDVRIVFDLPFGGLIYSKGYYGDARCQYSSPGNARAEHLLTVYVGSCGAQLVEQPGAPAYLENILIIQNEPGIQEVWDTARNVRCVFDGASHKKQTVSASLNVAMLDQEVVSFAADVQASATMDIQVGRGPYAPSAAGLVKIGELMTMVVAVEGPKGFDILVRQCVAHDGTSVNSIQLTDESGCVLKKKLMGSWQKTFDTGSPNSPVIAFSHFQAFKFPDKMDVYIECQVDLCKDDCGTCPSDTPQSYDGRRRKRAIPVRPKEEPIGHLDDYVESSSFAANSTRSSSNSGGGGVGLNGKSRNGIMEENKIAEPVRLARRLRVLSPEDISLAGDSFSTITLVSKATPNEDDICFTMPTFVIGLVTVLVVLVISSIMTAILCVRIRTIPSAASTYPPDSSFHAFSTVSGKQL